MSGQPSAIIENRRRDAVRTHAVLHRRSSRAAPGGRGGGLWANRDFRALFLGQGAGLLGYQVAGVLIPLYAVRSLNASSAQVGFLVTCEYIGYLLIGLPAGAWVDRWRTERVLVVSSLLRGLALATIPILALCGISSIGLLYAAVLAASICTVFFSVAYQTVLPDIVQRQHLTGSNALLETSRSVAEIVGPSAAGFMMALMPAQDGVLVTSASFLVSSGMFSALRVARTVRPPRAALLPQVWEGVRYVLGQPVFRAMVARSSTYNFCNVATSTMFLLLLASQLRLSSSYIGLIFSGAGVGAGVGAAAASRLARRFGTGSAVVGACIVAGLVSVTLPLAHSAESIAVAAVGYAVASGAILVSNVLQLTVRQSLCPPAMLGRMNATMRFLLWGVIPLGASVAGAVSGLLGIRTTLALAVAGEIVSIVPLYFSPLRRLRLVAEEKANDVVQPPVDAEGTAGIEAGALAAAPVTSHAEEQTG